MRHLRSLAAVAACLTWPLAASAAYVTISHTGSLNPGDPNDVALVDFSLTTAGSVTLQSWGYGGGTNGAGTAIGAGGFDPYFSLFAGVGNGATFLASNDDGGCPPGNVDPSTSQCLDSSLTMALAAGSYTLAITLPANFSFAENDPAAYSTLGDGFIGLAGDFSDYLGNPRSGAWAVDITTTSDGQSVPEPSALALVLAGLLAAAVRRKPDLSSGSMA